MGKKISKIIALITNLILVACLIGGCNEAERVNNNITEEAQNF